MLGERVQGAVPVPSQADLREEAGHEDALLEVAEPRLGALALRKGESELGVAAARGEWEREPAAEAGVDVGHRQAAVRLAEALHVRRPLDPDGLRHAGAVLD